MGRKNTCRANKMKEVEPKTWVVRISFHEVIKILAHRFFEDDGVTYFTNDTLDEKVACFKNIYYVIEEKVFISSSSSLGSLNQIS